MQTGRRRRCHGCKPSFAGFLLQVAIDWGAVTQKAITTTESLNDSLLPRPSFLSCRGALLKVVRSVMLLPQAPGGLTPNATPLHIAAAKGYTLVVSAILHAWVSTQRF